MKDTLSRVLLCLTALDLSKAELHGLIVEFQSMPLEAIIDRVEFLRRSVPAHFVDDYRIRFTHPRSVHQDSSVGQRVERLLRDEAGLSTSQAVEKLSSRLVEMGLIEGQQVPPLSRKSLRDWVGRLIKNVSAKDVLRVATILRNEIVHSPVNDWVLRP